MNVFRTFSPGQSNFMNVPMRREGVAIKVEVELVRGPDGAQGHGVHSAPRGYSYPEYAQTAIITGCH